MTSDFAFHQKPILYLAAGVVIVLAIAYALDFTRRRRLMETVGHAGQLARMTASASSARRIAKAALTVFGVAMMALALARPQAGGERFWKPRGIDMVVVMDMSKSMLATDVAPSRIRWAAFEADELIDRFKGERVGVVAFGGEAIHYPLTSDYEAVKLLYHGLDPHDMPPGTDIGQAVLTARCLLLPNVAGDADCARVRGARETLPGVRPVEPAELGDRGRAIVLFTDGEETEGQARAQVARAAELGIDVFVVGVGTPAGAQIPTFDERGNPTGPMKTRDGDQYVITRLDQHALLDLARAGGGEDHYFHADPRRFTIEDVTKALAKLKEGKPEERTEIIPSEAYPYFLFPGFLALLVEACLSERRRLRPAGSDKVQA
jgi:Ca-activated chloride channel homolog